MRPARSLLLLSLVVLASTMIQSLPAAENRPPNIVILLMGDAAGKPHETLFWRFGEQWAIRRGDWRLVAARSDNNQVKLFDLVTDLGEANALTASRGRTRQRS